MPRIARVVIPGLAHHITQRSVKRMNVFFSNNDRLAYLDLVQELLRDSDGIEDLRRHTRTGRPLGSESFLEHAEAVTRRTLRLRESGRKWKK